MSNQDKNQKNRKAIYDLMVKDNYNLADFDSFNKELDSEEGRKELYDILSNDNYDVGDYESFNKKIYSPQGYTLDEMKATPMTERYSAAPEPSKNEKFGLDSGIPSIGETTKAMIDGRFKMVEKPIEQTQVQSQPVEPLTKLGEGLEQGANNMVAGAKYDIAETVIKPVVGTQQDDYAALGRLAQIEAEDKNVAEETKWDAKKALSPKLATLTSVLAKYSPKYDTENPNIEIAGADSYDAQEYARRENEAQADKVIRKALEESDGDVEKAKLIIATQAGKETHADVLQKAAVKKMSEAKPTKGWAWIGEMIPQMVLPATGMVLSGVTGIPAFAQVLGGVNMGVLTASTAGQAMAEARQAGASNSQVWASGIINGIVELGTEYIQYDRLTGRIIDAAMGRAKQVLGKAVSEVGSPANKELKDLLSKANKRLDGKLFSGKNVEEYIGDIAAESMSEATAEGLQTIIPIIYENPENYPTFWEIINNMSEGAKGGAFMNIFLGGTSKAAEHRMNRARRKAQGYVDVAEVTTPDGNDEIVEVVRNEQDQPVFLWNGEQIPISKNNVKQRHQFNFDDFERGQFQLEEDEAYENGKTLETPAEMTDANNMYEIAAIELAKRSLGLQDQEIDSKSKEDVEGIVNQIELMYGGNPLQKAHDIRDTDSETSDLILNYAYAKATRDGIVDAARDRISEETAQAESIIDYRKNKNDGMIHPATLKTKDANGNDRQVYVVSGNIATFEDGTINTQESDNDIIIQDAVTGKPEFATAKDLLRAEQAIDPEVEKQNVRNTIADTIATEVENKMNNVLPFNVGDAYNIIGADGAEHSVQVMADNGDGSVMASIDNAEAVAMPKSEIQQLSNEYNMNRARLANEAQKEAKQSEKMMQEAQNVEPTQEDVAEVAQPQIPTNEQGEPMYEQVPVADTWAELVALNEGNEEEAIDTANIMLQNAQKALDDANKTPKAKGSTVAEIQAAKAERKALIDEAQARVDYWSNVVGYRGSQPQQVVTETAPVVEEQVTEKPSNYAERNAELGDYLDFRDYVMRAISTKGVKFIWKDSDTGTRGLRAHLGLSPKELGAHLWMLDNKVGLYPEVAAEQLLASYTEEIGGEPNIDTMDALSEILDVIGSYPNQAKMFQAAMERHGENADAQAQAEEDAIFYGMRAEAEQNGMTVEDWILYQDMMQEYILPIFDGDYEQIIANFVESAFNEETLNQNNNERGRDNDGVQQGVHREGGLSDGGETGIGVLQTERMDDGSRDSGSVEAGQGGDVQAVEQSIDDIPATEVSGRAEEVKEKTISAPAQEADISDEDITALWIKSRDELWKPNDELGQMLHEKLYEAHPEEHQPEDRKKVVRHLIEAVEEHKDHPIAKEVLKYVKYPTTTSMRSTPTISNKEENRRKPLRERANESDLKKKMHNNNVVHLKDSFFDSEGRLIEPQNEGSDLVPTPNVSSESKDTTSEPQKQEVDEKILQENEEVEENATDSASLAEDVTAIESNVDEKPANKPKSDKKIEDFGEKIGGARKDVARARLLDTVKLSAKDLESLKDPDKILSRKAIIKYMEEGQMTENDGISLLALNMATRGKYRKALTMEKYREVALQWERGEDIDVGITEQDIDKYMANMPEAARVKPNARERAISDLERIILTPYNDYRDTYIALNYPAEYRNLRGTYIYKTAWNDKVVVVSGIDSRRGFVFNTYEQAVAKIKRDFPIVEFEKSKEKSAAKDNKDSEGHLNITKDDMGWYRIKSRSIPGNIYLSGRFRTKKDAEAYLEQNKEVLLEREQKMTESLMGSNIGMVEREGVDYRNGQDVTPEDFLNTFGFRGVEFGNWVPQAERQLYLNKTYDAIMDFCNIIGISPKAFSLGGELALAFGARGKSRALAHYEPLKMVINLTRMKGAGSLAHEWFHAFDNYISKRKTGNISDMATARFAAERDEVSRAFYDLVSKMNSMDYTKRSKRAGEYWGEVEERAARLLENYIYNELERKSQVSPLLVRKDTLFNEEEIPEEDYVKSAWPYPSARENKEIKPYFDHLFSTLEEKVDEQGNVILFRSSAPTYDDFEIRFAELQREYDALNKDDEQALNAWRDKKAEVVRSFMEGKTKELNLPTKNFRIVKNKEELRSLYNDYSSAMNKWMQDTNKDFVSIDSFNKFKERLSKAQALYSPVMDVIACDINSFPNDEVMAFTVLFHEQTHSVIDKVFKQKQLKDIWDEALINDAKNANDISANYGDDVYENGNEYLAFILERFTFANFRNRLESFIKGDEAVLVDDLMKNAKETLPLRNEAIKKILKFYNDGYRKERGFRAETRNDGLGRGYAEGSREATTESSRGGSQSSRERRRSEVVEAATDLASSLGVKLNVIEDVNEITDSNIYNQRRKRGSKAWYSVTTGKVYFVLPNAESVADAQRSVLHEVVAHKGLRALFGKEFGEFINKVYQNADESIRTKIVELSKNKGWKIDVATEEYLASLAENTNFEDTNPSWWAKIKELFLEMFDKIGIEVFDKVTLTDNELRYILWRSYQMQKSQGAMAVAEDVLMQQKLGVGNFRTRPAGTRQMTEEEQIIADAKANGTYLKAPNGKKSNLTPKQWVQVRTKAFKKWFGDWEKAARIEKLRKSKDAEITGNEIEASEDLKQYKKNAQMYGRTLQGEYTNVDTGAVISLQRGRHNGGINEVLQHNYKDAAHLQSVAAIPQIIENGIYIESQPNKDTDTNPDVKEYQMFVCGLKIGGEDYTVLAKVAVDSKGNRYYDHNLVSVEKGKLIDIANNEQSAISSGFGTTPDTKSTTNSQRKYKELISLLQTNSSKIVDANGEPKVVEHSTWNDDFYTFDIEHLGESSGDEGVYGAGFYFGNIGNTEIYGDRAIQAYLNMRNPIVLPDAPIMGFFDYLVKNFDKEGLRDIVVKQGNKVATMGEVVDAIKAVNNAHARGEYADLIEQMSQYWHPADKMVLEQQIFRKIGFAIYGTLQPFIEYNVGRKEFSEALRNAGYDGVVYDSTEYVAFNPNQIKSATDNVGTFDANNDDIRFRTTPKSADIEDGEVKGESKEISKEDKMQNAIRELRKIVKSTKAFRKSLATIIASNLKEIVTDDVINVMGKSEFNALVKQVQEANIQQDAVKPLERIEEIISDLRIKDKEQRINKLLSMKVQGETKSGVSVAQSVDDATRELFTYLKDNINRPIDEIRRSLEGRDNHILANLVADIASPYQEATALKREIFDIDEEIKALNDVNTNLRGLLKDADDQKAKQLKQTIKHNKEKVSALETERLHIKAQIEQQLDFVYNTLFDAMQEGRGLYKTFVYENMLRKSEMVDMAIKDIDTGETLSVLLNPPTRWKAAKDKVADLLLSPANSLNHLLKKITINAPNGEGDMYDYFIRGKNGYVAASEKFYNGYNEFKEELNKKAKSVFGKPYIKVLADSNNLSNVTITVTTNDRKQDVPLTLGQAMYVYMVNKMPDGKIKLTNMGIFDEDVEKLRNSLPAEYIVFADWLQNKFLPKRRKEYNETHLEIFGTQMASIENYVPLRNKKDEIYKEVDGTQQEDFALPTTITGSIINRRRNNVILDLTTNALDLMLSHGQEMEHWNAYTPVVKDMNSLLSSTKFRLMLENRRRGWWDDMNNAAKIAAGQYNPKTDKLNEAWAVISKGAVASKISFRIWTAMKQVLSFPAFMAYSTSARFYGALAKNIVTPYNAWVWGMQNLPILNKRWSERSLGNEKLSQVTRAVFDKIIDESAKKGMMPNAFVDALTCAIGAKAVYDYKVKEYEAQMYNKDEAEYRAKIDATLAFNESQQSAEGLFLSQLQSNRDGLSTAFATFNNQNYGYLRKTIEAFLELRRKRDKEVAYLQDRYIKRGIMPDDAERLARSKVKEIKKTAVLSAAMYGFILNTIWTLGSNVFKYAFSDDEDEVMKDVLKSLLIAPVRNTTIGSTVESVVQGYNVNLSVLISDINAMIDRSSTINVTRWDRTAAYLTLKLVASMAVGVDMDTLVRLYEGIEGMINDGVDVEDIMAIINAPRSQALMAARPPKEDESVKEYIERMDKIDRKIDSRISDSMRKTWINNYYMYQLANKNELNVSRDDFGKVSIIEYKQLIDEMKKTKEREKEYEGKGIPQSDLDAFAQQPEYKRMEIVDEHQKEINKSLKKLKTELSDSDRAKEEQNLYNEMRSLLKKIKPLGLSNK